MTDWALNRAARQESSKAIEQHPLRSDWLRGFGAAYNIPWGQSQVTIILTGQYKICAVSHIILTGQYKICDVNHRI